MKTKQQGKGRREISNVHFFLAHRKKVVSCSAERCRQARASRESRGETPAVPGWAVTAPPPPRAASLLHCSFRD